MFSCSCIICSNRRLHLQKHLPPPTLLKQPPRLSSSPGNLCVISGGHWAQALYFKQKNRCHIRITQVTSSLQLTLHPITTPQRCLPMSPAAPPHRAVPGTTRGLFHTNLSRSHVSLDIPTRTGEFAPCTSSWGLTWPSGLLLAEMHSLPVPASEPQGWHRPLCQLRQPRMEAGRQPAQPPSLGIASWDFPA